MSGAFGLSTPRDLLAKLQRELGRLRDSPNDRDVAINYFVTAEHILDWLIPGESGRPRRKKIRESEPLLMVVSHLANSAKHHSQLSSHHQSVSSSGQAGGYFPATYFPPSYFACSHFGGRVLSVILKGKAAHEFGPSISTIELAERVYSYWESHHSEYQSPRLDSGPTSPVK